MILADISPFLKLWYKGVDIAANAITAFLVVAVWAVIAAFLYHRKLARDLRRVTRQAEHDSRFEETRKRPL